jgi:hypothetical protein
LLFTSGEDAESGVFKEALSSFLSSSSLPFLLFSAFGILKLVDLKLEPRPSAKLAKLEDEARSGGVFGLDEPLDNALKLLLLDASDSELLDRCFALALPLDGSYLGWSRDG